MKTLKVKNFFVHSLLGSYYISKAQRPHFSFLLALLDWEVSTVSTLTASEIYMICERNKFNLSSGYIVIPRLTD